MKKMPELPEVETIRRIIGPQISGRSITSLEIHNPQIIAFPDADTFSSSLVGCSFTGMSRRGKFLIFHLNNGSRLVLHLRMTGQLLVTPTDHQEEKHGTVALFSHGGSSAAALGHILDLPFPYACGLFHIEFTGITIVRMDWRAGHCTLPCLELANDGGHLRGI